MPASLQQLAQVSPSSTSFSPKEVTGAFGKGQQVRLADSSLWARRDLLIKAHGDWKSRVQKITMVANGEWYRVWPDLTREPSAPSVANVIELGIAHMGAVGGSIVPSIKVPVPHKDKGPEGSRGAAKRERRVRELRERSNLPLLLSMLWQDYAGAGAACLAVWANFEEPNPAKRNPYYMRLDPRHYYPVKDGRGNLTELLVARKRNLYDIQQEYPHLKGQFDNDSDVEEWFWYDDKRFRHILADVSPKGKKAKLGFTLVDVENELGRVPAVEVVRPSFDGERRGHFDQVVHILRTMHHLMSLTVEASEEDVYPPVGGYEVEGLETFGPGSIHRYLTADAKIDRLSPTSRFDVKDLIARLEENARAQATYPQQLTGDPGASIVSRVGIQASMGALDARLTVAHRQFEWLLTGSDGLLLQFDEVYCDGTKTIYGDVRDRKNPEEFKPSRDIGGNYEVVVSYGLGAGTDPTNREMRLQMHLAAKLVSRERAREELDYLEDPMFEELRLAKEASFDGVVMGAVAAGQAGDIGPALILSTILAENPDATVDEIVLKLGEAMGKLPGTEQTPPGAGLPEGGVEDVLNAGESLARGGGPQAEGMQGMLPPLAGIMGQDNRQSMPGMG